MGILHKYVENKPVRDYNSFKKKYKFCHGDEITVKVKEKFAVEFTANFTLPPGCQEAMGTVENKSKEIELLIDREFYPYPEGTCGGDTHCIYVFRATKKGEFKIEFSSYTLNVKCI